MPTADDLFNVEAGQDVRANEAVEQPVDPFPSGVQPGGAFPASTFDELSDQTGGAPTGTADDLFSSPEFGTPQGGNKGDRSRSDLTADDLFNLPPLTPEQQASGYLNNRLQHYRELGGASFGERLAAGTRSLLGVNNIDEREQARQAAGQFGAGVGDVLPFVGHLMSFDREMLFSNAVDRIQAGNGTNNDFDYVAQFITTQERNQNASFFESVATGAIRVPAFMAELMLTGGAASAGYAGAAGAVGTRLGAGAVGTAARGLAGASVGLAAWTAANPLSVIDAASQRARPQVGFDSRGQIGVERDGDWVTQLPAGFLDTAIEIGSEQAGEGLGIAGKALTRTRLGPLMQAAGQRWANSFLGQALNLGDGAAITTARSFAQQTGYHGIAGEMFEERVGEIARGVTGLTRDREGNREYGTTGALMQGRYRDAADLLAREFVMFGTVSVAFGIAQRAMVRGGATQEQANVSLDEIQAALAYEGTTATRARAREVVEQLTEEGSPQRMAGMAMAEMFDENGRPETPSTVPNGTPPASIETDSTVPGGTVDQAAPAPTAPMAPAAQAAQEVDGYREQMRRDPRNTPDVARIDARNAERVAAARARTDGVFGIEDAESPTNAVQPPESQSGTNASSAAPAASVNESDWQSAYASATARGMSQEEAQREADRLGDQEWISTGTQFGETIQQESGSLTPFTARDGQQYTIEITNDAMDKFEKDGFLRLVVRDANGEEASVVGFDRRGKTRGGRYSGTDYTAGLVKTKEGFRKKGLANALYDFAASQFAELRASGSALGGRVLPSDGQTKGEEGGRMIWEQNAKRAMKAKAAPAVDPKGKAPAQKVKPKQDPIVLQDARSMLRTTGLTVKEAAAKVNEVIDRAEATFTSPQDLVVAAFDKGDQKAATYQSIDEAEKNVEPGEIPSPKTRAERLRDKVKAKMAQEIAKAVAPPTMKAYSPEARDMTLQPGEEFMTPEMKSDALAMFERMANGEVVSPEEIERVSGLNKKESHVLFQRLQGRTLEDIGEDQVWGKKISKQAVAKWEAKSLEKSGLSKDLRERIQAAEKARRAAELIANGKKMPFDKATGNASKTKLKEVKEGNPALAAIANLIIKETAKTGVLTDEQRAFFEREIARAGSSPTEGIAAPSQAPANVSPQGGAQAPANGQGQNQAAQPGGQGAEATQDPMTLAMRESERRMTELEFAKAQLAHWVSKRNETGGRQMVEFMKKKVRKAQTAANAAEKMVRGIEKAATGIQSTGNDALIEMNLRKSNITDFMREELELQKSKYGGAVTVMQEILQSGKRLDIDQARRLIGKEVLESFPPQLFQKNGLSIDLVAQEMEGSGRIPETPASKTSEQHLMDLISEHYLTEAGRYDEVVAAETEEQFFREEQEAADLEAEEERAAIQDEGSEYTGEEEVAPGVSFYDPRQVNKVQAGQLPPGPDTGNIVGPFQFIKTALEMFGLERYVGKVRQNADAAYLENIRALEASGMKVGDVPIAMHEIGHDIMATNKLTANPVLLQRLAGADVPLGFKQFDYDQKRKMGPQAIKEGFAEWLRIRTTSNFVNLTPQQVAAAEWAERWIKEKGIDNRLDRLRDMYRAYVNANPTAKAATLISPDGKPVKAAGLSSIEAMQVYTISAAERFQDMFDDRLAVFNRMMEERARLGMAPTVAGMDPRTVIAQTEFMTAAWADEMAGKGMFTFVKDPDIGWVKTTFGRPVQTIIENIKPGELERFKIFLVANYVVNEVNRGIEQLKSDDADERAEGERRANTGTPDQIAAFSEFLEEVKLDQDLLSRFLDGSRRYTEKWSETLDAMVQVGFKRQDEVDRLREKYPDFVSLVRVMEDKDFKATIGESRKGSGRQFIDPFVTLEARYRLLSQIMARQLAHDSLWQAGQQAAGPAGIGAFWKEVEGGIEKRYTDIGKVLEAMGVDDQLRDDLLDMIGTSIDVVQAPAWREGAKNTFTMLIDGQFRTIEVADKALYEALTHTQGTDSKMVGFARALADFPGMAQAVQGMKWGATTASMVFQPRNAIRDPWAYFQNVRGDRGFLGNFADLLAGHRDSFWAALAKTLNVENSDVYANLYRESSGLGLRDFSYQPEGAGAQGWRAVKGEKGSKTFKVIHKVNDVLELMGAGEHGPRMAEFRHALQEMGYSRGKIEAALKADPNTSPIPLSILLYARQRAANATVDFARGGVVVKEWNKVAPFFGAHMAAMSQEIRNWNEARKELQAGKPGKRATAMLGGLGVYLTAELLHYWLRKDEPWYQELPAHLRHGWFILGQTKDGGVWGIPKPQGMLRMIGAYFQETLRYAGDRDPRYGMATSSALQAAVPRVSPLGVGEALQIAGNTSWSGRPIVPGQAQRSMSEFDQWARYRVPYLLEQMTGGLASERAIRPPWEAFKASRAQPRQTVDDYYARLGDLTRARSAAQRMQARFEFEPEYTRLHSIETRMQDLNRELRGQRRQGRQVVNGTPPTPERAAAIRLEQLQLARRVMR